jgi:nucleoside 2-deoxyribosyltransferase
VDIGNQPGGAPSEEVRVSTKVYVAGPWKHKERAKEVAQQLRCAGFDVVSRWHEFREDPTIGYEYPEQIMATEAQNDIADLNCAEAVLYLNLEKSEGKATELGYAMAKGLPIYVVGGKQNNVFLHLDPGYGINHIDSVEAFIGTQG